MLKTTVVIATLLAITLGTVVPRVDPVVSHVPRTYKVNLEDPPEVRWRTILHDYADPLQKFMEYFDTLPIPESFFHGVEFFAKNVYNQR